MSDQPYRPPRESADRVRPRRWAWGLIVLIATPLLVAALQFNRGQREAPYRDACNRFLNTVMTDAFRSQRHAELLAEDGADPTPALREGNWIIEKAKGRLATEQRLNRISDERAADLLQLEIRDLTMEVEDQVSGLADEQKVSLLYEELDKMEQEAAKLLRELRGS